MDIPVALGWARSGPKRVAGDGRTPVGSYHVILPPRSSRFHLFVPIDYPSVEDAARALAAGTIAEDEYDRIRNAHDAGLLPPQDTPLGGHLGFHGEGHDWRGRSETSDWTLGCIAMSDEDVEFLAKRLTPNALVEIRGE